MPTEEFYTVADEVIPDICKVLQGVGLAAIFHERCGFGKTFLYRRRNKESNAILAKGKSDPGRFSGFQERWSLGIGIDRA